MEPKSANGFTFSAAVAADGTSITLVAHKEDHEGRKTEVFHFLPAEASLLAALVRGSVEMAKRRRKEIRRAAREAEGEGDPP